MLWKPAFSVASGAIVTVSSTFVACSFASQIEKNANRLMYWYAPESYSHVDGARGLTEEQLRMARLLEGRRALQLSVTDIAKTLTPTE